MGIKLTTHLCRVNLPEGSLYIRLAIDTRYMLLVTCCNWTLQTIWSNVASEAIATGAINRHKPSTQRTKRLAPTGSIGWQDYHHNLRYNPQCVLLVKTHTPNTHMHTTITQSHAHKLTHADNTSKVLDTIQRKTKHTKTPTSSDKPHKHTHTHTHTQPALHLSNDTTGGRVSTTQRQHLSIEQARYSRNRAPVTALGLILGLLEQL